MAAMRTPIEFPSADGTLRLHAETRGSPDAPLTVLCLHGLTRNSADFGALAEHLSARYRVITADQRGRGKSQWDPNPANYRPAIYVSDMFQLLDRLQIARVVLIGTSMGGIMSMIMGATQPARVQAIVLNDIGPEVPNSGLRRLRDSLNAPARIATWQDAARQAQRVNGLAFPDYSATDWEAFARRTYVEDPEGHPIAAYDPSVLTGLNKTDLSAVPANLWSQWAQLGSIPTLAIRGELSDILSADTLTSMAAQHPKLVTVSVPGRGHAPMLDEPAAASAIDTFLDGVEP
jgi:pimeloyl-ACP methyl ester carboxylesterase